MSYEFAVSIGMGLTTFLFAFLAVNFKGEHKVLQLLFLGFTITSAVATTWVLVLLSRINLATTIEAVIQPLFIGLVIVLVFVFGYFMILFIRNAFRLLGGSDQEEE